MNHRQPLEAYQTIETGQHVVDPGRARHVVAGAPQVRGVKAEAEPAVEASTFGPLEYQGQLFDPGANGKSTARRVLEDDLHRGAGLG